MRSVPDLLGSSRPRGEEEGRGVLDLLDSSRPRGEGCPGPPRQFFNGRFTRGYPSIASASTEVYLLSGFTSFHLLPQFFLCVCVYLHALHNVSLNHGKLTPLFSQNVTH